MVTIIFKAIEKCLSNCVYCEVIKKRQNKIMSYDTLEVVFSRMNDFLVADKHESIQFTWHGGEVTLLGSDFFNRIIEIQDKLCPSTKTRIYHLVQSNLLKIDIEIINAFKKLGIQSIGSSYDPIDGIRGIGKNRDSVKYKNLFFSGVNLLNNNGMSWGVINVVHRKQLDCAVDIYNYLSNITRHLSFTKVYFFSEDLFNLDISQVEYADFLGSIFPYWLKDRLKSNISVAPFDSFYDATFNNKFGLVCERSGDCAFRWIYIGPNGDTSHCGRAGDSKMVSYGNIYDHSLYEMFNHNDRNLIHDRQKILTNGECSNCRLWGICHGGCVIDAYELFKDFSRKSPNCEWLKIFIEKYFEPILNIKVNFSR